jgi:hypothetical protein
MLTRENLYVLLHVMCTMRHPLLLLSWRKVKKVWENGIAEEIEGKGFASLLRILSIYFSLLHK